MVTSINLSVFNDFKHGSFNPNLDSELSIFKSSFHTSLYLFELLYSCLCCVIREVAEGEIGWLISVFQSLERTKVKLNTSALNYSRARSIRQAPSSVKTQYRRQTPLQPFRSPLSSQYARSPGRPPPTLSLCWVTALLGPLVHLKAFVGCH